MNTKSMKTRILLLYSTTDGQTLKIAKRIETTLAEHSVCELVAVEDATQINLSSYQKVVLGASIRYGHLSRAFVDFVSTHAEQLNRIPSAFFCVNLTARKADKATPATNPYCRKFLSNSDWQPNHCAVFAGALLYSRYRFWDKQIIRLIMTLTKGNTDTSRDIEYTDWNAVDRFAMELISG